MAYRIKSARLFNASLRMMLALWASTVLVEMNSLAAISLLE